jgi:hypothetical protein
VVQRYKEIILHAGPGKTGTTSIQKNCHKYREFLRGYGIVYPAFKLNGRQLVNHSDPITGAVCDPPTKYGMGWRQGADDNPEAAKRQLREQWEPLLREPQGDKLILSGESIAEYSDEDMQTLRAELQPYTERLRVVAYIRSPQSSLESILQQRVKGGAVITKESILGVVKKRYQNLLRNFGELLEVVNFHQAVQHPHGLVGSFMALAGVPGEEIPDLDFSASNERVSMEAFGLMSALNERYSRRQMAEHGVQREVHDLKVLKNLPGQPFQIEGFADSALDSAIREEGAWLEQQLGFQFPEVKRRELEPQWQTETLIALESTVRKLKQSELRNAAADYLTQQAEKLNETRRDTTAVLKFIAKRLRAIDNSPLEGAVDELGAEHFRRAAQQVEGHSLDLAEALMTIALEMRPGGKMIKQKLEAYRKRRLQQKPHG